MLPSDTNAQGARPVEAPEHPVPDTGGAAAEVDRVLQICNACRYCEGFCAVFPAMTRRIEFNLADIQYLSNLCHNCGACLHACQYAPPHEFAVNVPRAMARVRTDTYHEHAWPHALGALYRRNGLTLALATAAGLAMFLVALLLIDGASVHRPLAGNFYAVLPHRTMVVAFGAVFLFDIVALAIATMRFWRTLDAGRTPGAALTEATHDVLSLRYLDGGHGKGCNESDDRFTKARRHLHHFAFYGFLLCFASTCVATLYHYGLRWPAPYPLTSLPVLLGIAGGVSMLVGCGGLLALYVRRHPLHRDPAQAPMDLGFVVLLLLTALTGLVLTALRDTSAMAIALAIHLGIVMALFLTLPYGKFAHGFYRSAALLKYAIERRQPPRLNLGPD